MRLATSLAALLCIAACANGAATRPNSACGSGGAYTFYFPKGVFSDDAEREALQAGKPYSDYSSDEFWREAYSESLFYMKEPTLSCGPARTDESYRFLWKRSFDPAIAIRVERNGDRYTLRANIFRAWNWEDYGKINWTDYAISPIAKRVDRTLSKAEWDGLVAQMRAVDFWNMTPTHIEPKPVAPQGMVVVVTSPKDGSSLVFEGRSDAYHVVYRHSGEDGTWPLARVYLDLAGIKLTEDEIY